MQEPAAGASCRRQLQVRWRPAWPRQPSKGVIMVVLAAFMQHTTLFALGVPIAVVRIMATINKYPAVDSLTHPSGSVAWHGVAWRCGARAGHEVGCSAVPRVRSEGPPALHDVRPAYQ